MGGKMGSSWQYSLFSIEGFLIKPTERIVSVRPKRSDSLKPHPLIEADRFGLVNPCFQAQAPHSLRARIRRQMLDHQLAQTQTPKIRTHIHPFDFSILQAK